MIIPTSSARILVYSQNYTTFGPSQLAFLSTVRSTLLLDRLSSHFSVQSKAIYFTGLSSLSESPLRALSATHILFWTTTGTAVLQSVLLQSPKGWRPPFLSSAASVHRTKSALLFVPIRKSALLFGPVTQSALLFDPVSVPATKGDTTRKDVRRLKA